MEISNFGITFFLLILSSGPQNLDGLFLASVNHFVCITPGGRSWRPILGTQRSWQGPGPPPNGPTEKLKQYNLFSPNAPKKETNYNL